MSQQKLDHVLKELKRVAFPDEGSDPEAYWNDVEVSRDNATDYICDMDIFIKNLITYIESE